MNARVRVRASIMKPFRFISPFFFFIFFLSYSILYIYCFFNKGGMPTILLRIPAVKTDTFRLWTVLQVNASEYGKTQRKSTTYGLKSYFQAPSG